MKEIVFFIDKASALTLQEQLRRFLINAVLSGQLPANEKLPSYRKFAKNLGVSQNTVLIVYEVLVSEGFLVSKQRSGFFVNPELLPENIAASVMTSKENRSERGSGSCIRQKLNLRLDNQDFFHISLDWLTSKYPFIYGQMQPDSFPISEWRDCSKQAQNTLSLKYWVNDLYSSDDELLISQLKNRLLLRVGIQAQSDEIMVTLGSQNALFIIAQLLGNQNRTLGIEDPGYTDARKIFELTGTKIRRLQMDDKGVVPHQSFEGIDFVFLTPGHQYPTCVTTPPERRRELLAAAVKHNFIIIEDDYENEVNFDAARTPSIKSLDTDGRVIYVSSISKLLSPGIRIGYMVAPSELISQAIRLRRLIYRHPPANNQRTLAYFIMRGNYDVQLTKFKSAIKRKRAVMQEMLRQTINPEKFHITFGGANLWVEGPKMMQTEVLKAVLKEKQVLVENGDRHFMGEEKPQNFMRLSLTSIREENLEAGAGILLQELNKLPSV